MPKIAVKGTDLEKLPLVKTTESLPPLTNLGVIELRDRRIAFPLPGP